MGAQVVSFLNWSHRAAPQPVADWSQQELAEFYRVEGALIRAGLSIETDRGLSDEGDPWFVFLRAEDGEVVVHFARVDGEYLIAGPAYEKVSRGYDFNALVRAMIARHPLVQPNERGGNILLHPAAILVAIVGTAFFKTGEAKAMDNDHRLSRKPTAATTSVKQAIVPPASAPADHIYVDANQALTIMAGALFAMEPRWDRKEQLVGSALIQIEGVAARAHLQAASISGAQDLKFDGLKTDAPHPTALAMATAQAPALLAVTALLSEVANGHTTDSAASQPQHEAIVPVLSESAGTNIAPQVYMDVNLRAGALPNVQAIQLLQEIANGGGFDKIAIIAVEKIPGALATIIAEGGNLNVAAIDSTHIVSDAAAPVTPYLVTPAVPAGPDADSATTVKPSDAGTSSTAGRSPTTDATPHTNFDTYLPLVQKLIDYFVTHVDRSQVMTTGSEVVFYDTRVFNHPEQFQYLDSLTFHFNDGSSVSFVGEHSTLYHDFS
jgi:hypothetical protein